MRRSATSCASRPAPERHAAIHHPICDRYCPGAVVFPMPRGTLRTGGFRLWTDRPVWHVPVKKCREGPRDCSAGCGVTDRDELRSVSDGNSPNSVRYASAKRPSSPKPRAVAISVTVVVAGSASARACRTRFMRRNQRCRRGLMPRYSMQCRRSVRSPTPIAAQFSGI